MDEILWRDALDLIESDSKDVIFKLVGILEARAVKEREVFLKYGQQVRKSRIRNFQTYTDL